MYNHPLKKYLRVDRMPHIFCPGCGSGQIMNAMLMAIDEMNLDINNFVFIGGVGCNSRQVCWIKADAMHGLHGRAFAWATGVKLSSPDLKVIILTGDGDCAAIGGNHFIHAARRNIDMTTIVSNNFNYGMTGGQFAPTSPIGTKTTTTPLGSIEYPFDLCKLAQTAGATYVSRWSTLKLIQLKKSIKKAITHKGFSFLEVLSPCPTNFGRRELHSSDPLVNQEYIKKITRTQKKKKNDVESDTQNTFVLGDFYKEDKPTYYDQYLEYMKLAQKGMDT